MDDWKASIGPLRDVIRPFIGSAEKGKARGDGTNNWRPSREHSIEELPIALAFMLVSGGDFEGSILGAANYGRDNDSIASMAGAITGALHGRRVIRAGWMTQINEANRIDLFPLAKELAALTLHLQRKQLVEAQARNDDFAAMLDD